MYATAMSFAVRCVAIFILLTFRKVRDILRQWYEDKLALEVSTPRFDLDFRCPSEDTADDVVQLPTADAPGESGETAESTQVDCPWIAVSPPPRFYVGPAMFITDSERGNTRGCGLRFSAATSAGILRWADLVRRLRTATGSVLRGRVEVLVRTPTDPRDDPDPEIKTGRRRDAYGCNLL